jgi:hypothetical protein
MGMVVAQSYAADTVSFCERCRPCCFWSHEVSSRGNTNQAIDM